MDARRQALRELVLCRAEEALAREADVDERVTYERLIQSLQNGRLVWEDVCMFVVKLHSRKVTVNVILGVTSTGALTVSSYAGKI